MAEYRYNLFIRFFIESYLPVLTSCLIVLKGSTVANKFELSSICFAGGFWLLYETAMLWTVIFLIRKYDRIKEALSIQNKKKESSDEEDNDENRHTTDEEGNKVKAKADAKPFDIKTKIFPLERYNSFFEELKHQNQSQILYFPVFLTHRTVIAYLLIFGNYSYMIQLPIFVISQLSMLLYLVFV